MAIPKALFSEPVLKTQFGAEHSAAVDIAGSWVFEGHAESVREAVTRYNAHDALVADKARLVEALHKIAYEPIGHPEASYAYVYNRLVEEARAALDAVKGGAA